jgi:hypothetical protein
MNVHVSAGNRVYRSPSGEETVQVSGVPARFYSAVLYNGTGDDVYLQLHDTTTNPDPGDVPWPPVKIPSGSTGTLDFGVGGVVMANGIFLAASSTAMTFTDSSGTDCLFCCSYDER